MYKMSQNLQKLAFLNKHVLNRLQTEFIELKKNLLT